MSKRFAVHIAPHLIEELASTLPVHQPLALLDHYEDIRAVVDACIELLEVPRYEVSVSGVQVEAQVSSEPDDLDELLGYPEFHASQAFDDLELSEDEIIDRVAHQSRHPVNDCPTPQGRLVRCLRYGMFMTQKEFGDLVNINPVTIAQIESGAKDWISEKHAERIVEPFCDVLSTHHVMKGIRKVKGNPTGMSAWDQAMNLIH